MLVIYLPKVKKFVQSLNDTLAYRVVQTVDFLERYGNLLEMPLSRPLGKGLFELRITGNNHIRIFYCFHTGNAYLLHAIFKRTRAISRKDIDVARKVMRELY